VAIPCPRDRPLSCRKGPGRTARADRTDAALCGGSRPEGGATTSESGRPPVARASTRPLSVGGISASPSSLARATPVSGRARAPARARATLPPLSPWRRDGSAAARRLRAGSTDARGIAPASTVPSCPIRDQYSWPPAAQLPHHHHSLPATAAATCASTTSPADEPARAGRPASGSPAANSRSRGGGVNGAMPAAVRATDSPSSRGDVVLSDRRRVRDFPGGLLGGWIVVCGAPSSVCVVGRPWTRADSRSSAARRGALALASSSARARAFSLALYYSPGS
jgi:hypothetical protein